MISFDLLRALGSVELVQFLLLLILMDVPRYVISATVLVLIPPVSARRVSTLSISGLVACHNEEFNIEACIVSMRANGITEIVVVNDGSTDRTHEVAAGLDVILIDLPERIGKPLAMNVGLEHCTGDLVLVADADTTFDVGSVAEAVGHFNDPDVAAVGFDLGIANLTETLTTRFQAIEYAIALTAGRRLSDAFSTMANISGAAGLFWRATLQDIGGWDCEVAEDAALAMKLRATGHQLRHAPLAQAWTRAPETVIDLLMQRLRWDASIITIYWRKFRSFLNPFSPHCTLSNLFTSLDVLVFGALMPLILPIYLVWLWGRIEIVSVILLGAVLIALLVLNFVVVLLLGVPVRLLPYLPFYVLVQTFVLRPLRVIALVGELTFTLTHFDDYIPADQRWRLT